MTIRGSRWLVGCVAVVALCSVAPVYAEWNKGLEAYNAKDYATAVTEFEEVTKTNPDYAGAYYMLGLAQNGLKQRSKALVSLRKAVELDGDNASYRVALGQTLVQAKQYQDAYDTLKSLNMSSMDARYRSSYALIYAQAATRTNRAKEAVSVLSTQVQSDPKNARLYQALGSAQTASGDDRKAFDAYKKAFDLNSKDDAAGRNAVKAALSVARRGQGSDKGRYYTSAAQVAEGLVAAKDTFEHNLLAGEAWLGARNYNKALGWFDRAQAKQSQNALVRFYRGQCYSSLGQFDSSITQLQEALKIGATGKLRKQIYETMGYVYDKQKKYDDAANVYREAGNTAKVREMGEKKDKQAQNVQADEERQRFITQVAALRHQIEELEKLGGSEDEVKVLREQLVDLEKALQELR